MTRDEALLVEATRRGMLKPLQSGPLRPGYAPPKKPGWFYKTIAGPMGAQFDPVTGKMGGSYLEMGARPLAQGMSLGLYDEAQALGGATGQFLQPGQQQSFGDLYNQEIDKVRQEQQQQHVDYLTPALTIAGGLASGGPGAAGQSTLIAAPAVPQSLWQAMKTGASYGAAYGGAAGFASSEGGYANRLRGTAWGAGSGAIIGAAVPLSLKIGSLGWHGLQNMFGWGDPQIAAKNLVLRAMERDGITPEAALAKYNDWQAQGAKPEVLADLGGNNLKQLARTVISVPGEPADKAATMLYERNQGAGDRIVLDLASSGMPNEGYYNSLDDLIKSRSESAGPIYDEAYRAAGETWSPELARLEKRPSMATAWNRAKLLAAEQGRTLPDVFQENALQGLDNVPNQVPTLEAWDYMKQGLDDMLEKYRNPITGKLQLDKLGRAINETRKQLVAALDVAVEDKVGSPVYAMARHQWAGPSEAMDALQAGRDVFRPDMEVTANRIANMTDTEKQFYRIGVVRAIKDRIDKTKDAGSVLKQFWNSPGWRDKLEATFPDAQSFEQFRALMDREGNMFRTYSTGTQGSRTASLEQGQRELEQVSFLGDVFSGRWHSAAGQVMRRAQGINSAVADQIGAILFGPTQQAINNVATQRAAFLQEQARRTAMLQRGLVPLYAAGGRFGGAMNSNQAQ